MFESLKSLFKRIREALVCKKIQDLNLEIKEVVESDEIPSECTQVQESIVDDLNQALKQEDQRQTIDNEDVKDVFQQLNGIRSLIQDCESIYDFNFLNLQLIEFLDHVEVVYEVYPDYRLQKVIQELTALIQKNNKKIQVLEEDLERKNQILIQRNTPGPNYGARKRAREAKRIERRAEKAKARNKITFLDRPINEDEHNKILKNLIRQIEPGATLIIVDGAGSHDNYKFLYEGIDYRICSQSVSSLKRGAVSKSNLVTNIKDSQAYKDGIIQEKHIKKAINSV
ncbi:hypothetical protein CL656_00730 [bacterium]|nr:hypothetical protein [bacterium]|tara:strand:- start:1131 stop:1982 length:852 start_codon:yes stop_codon:yes gene_type:complete